MKFGIPILAISLVLGGCASAYDLSAATAANPARLLGYDKCNATFAGHGTNVGLVTCDLIVEKKWAVAIKLRNMAPYYSYANSVILIADDADAGRISRAERDNRLAIARSDYYASLRQAYEAAHRQNDDTASAWTLMGTAFLNGYNGARAATPPPIMTTCAAPPAPGAPINCLSY